MTQMQPELAPVGRPQFSTAATFVAALAQHLPPGARGVRPALLWGMLGLGSLTAASPERALSTWESLGCDALLLSQVQGLGLRVRALHPPSAAGGLPSSAEFEQHFIDSYLPLIRAALAHGQPVLAWRGWCGAEQAWGTITGIDGAAARGRVGGEAIERSLDSAAHQVYVIEQVEPAATLLEWPAERQLAQVLDAARAVMQNQGQRPFDVVLGRGALDYWLDARTVGEAAALDFGALAERRLMLAGCLQGLARAGARTVGMKAVIQGLRVCGQRYCELNTVRGHASVVAPETLQNLLLRAFQSEKRAAARLMAAVGDVS